MGRKTYTLSAVAIIATATLSFSSAYGAVALAQASSQASADESIIASTADSVEGDNQTAQSFEIVPADAGDKAPSEISFVSNPVMQSLADDDAAANAAPSDAMSDAGSLRELVGMVEPDDLTDQMQCLAGAVYFESRGEPLAGQLAVAQVVINRSEDARWPANYCGVVYQRAQFSFVKNGRMPRIRTSSQAWQRAKAIAQIAHEGLWESEAGEAVYFHAKYVRPKWSYRKERTARIDTHIFYR